MSHSRSFSLFLLSLVLVSAIRAEQPLADSTIVVYNKTIPESFDLAKFYAKQRAITRDHMIGLSCSGEEEISRTEYNDTIAKPLREAFQEHGWWTSEGTNVISSSIHFVAIIKGVPLKVRSTPDPGDEQGPAPIGNRNEASVDSELAMLAAYSSNDSHGARRSTAVCHLASTPGDL